MLVLLAVPAGYWVYVAMVTRNFHEVVPGQVYRSAQPTPAEIQRWARRYGIRTVLNLRGPSSRPFYIPERLAAEKAGVRLVDIALSAEDPPPLPRLRRLIHELETAERPLLIHCRAGADRTGVASVLAAMAIGGQDYKTARKQLSARYLHLGIRDVRIQEMLNQYDAYRRRSDLPPGGWEQFKAWALNDYSPRFYRLGIAPAVEDLTLRPGQLVSFRVRITNRAGQTVPAAERGQAFAVVAFTGSSEQERPDRELGPRIMLPEQDIDPGESVELDYVLQAPQEPGRYDVHLDVIHRDETWFARQGSPVPTIRLTVQPAGPVAPAPSYSEAADPTPAGG